MCGIAGLARAPLSTDDAEARVARMNDAIRHRGPDGGGVASGPGAALGMTRLAIVDVAHGHQPMASDDGDVVLVFNGEIYNAPALRAALEAKGARFRTRSDTEVILRRYLDDPATVERELVGMWAFAIHDRRRGRLVLSRDRFGIKPLFVTTGPGPLAFASELPCFDAVRDLLAPGTFDVDRASAHAMLSWGYVPEHRTLRAGVERLRPGHRLELDLGTGERADRAYYALRPSAEAGRVRSLGEAAELVEPLLARACLEHLESDVPLAAFVSGGIDSALVLHQAAKHRPVHAFSIGFREPRFDESPHARATAERAGVPIDVTYLDEATMRDALADGLLAYDEPFGDSSGLATFLLAQVVSKRFKVALAGDGGDEVFAGYTKHKIVRARRLLGRAPAVRDVVGRALSRLPLRTDRSRGWTNLLRVADRAAKGLTGTDDVAYAAITPIGALAKTAALTADGGSGETFQRLVEARFREAVGTELQRTLAADLGNPLPNDMLTKVDRATMACHLEARVPFLDHRVVEAGLGLPPAFTLGTKGKEVLRHLHRRVFGDALADRKKQGFGVPVEAWLRTSLDGACQVLFSRERLARHGLLSLDLADGGYRRWVEADPQVFWHAFAFAVWCEANLGEGREATRELLRREA